MIYQEKWWESSSIEDRLGTHSCILLPLSHCGFSHCGNSASRTRGASLLSFQSDHFSSGKAKSSQIKILFLLNPRKIFKRKILLYKHAYPHNNSCCTQTQTNPNKILQNLIKYTASCAVLSRGVSYPGWFCYGFLLRAMWASLPQPKIINLLCWLTGITSWCAFLLAYFHYNCRRYSSFLYF